MNDDLIRLRGVQLHLPAVMNTLFSDEGKRRHDLGLTDLPTTNCYVGAPKPGLRWLSQADQGFAEVVTSALATPFPGFHHMMARGGEVRPLRQELRDNPEASNILRQGLTKFTDDQN